MEQGKTRSISLQLGAEDYNKYLLDNNVHVISNNVIKHGREGRVHIIVAISEPERSLTCIQHF